MNLVIETALRLRWVVLLLAVGVIGCGVWAYQKQSIDAYPDISSQMVQIITVFPGRAPKKSNGKSPSPSKTPCSGCRAVENVRSRTIFGLSLVQMIFEEGTEGYWARQRVTEKLGDIVLPDGVSPSLGPYATAYGEIYRYELVSDGTHDLIQLRTLNDWVVTKHLRRVPGVAEVANFGGYEKQFAVTFDQAQTQTLRPDVRRCRGRRQEKQSRRRRQRRRRAAACRWSCAATDSSTTSTQIAGNLHQIDRRHPHLSQRPRHRRTSTPRSPNGIFSKDLPRALGRGDRPHAQRGESIGRSRTACKKPVKELNAETMPPGVKIVSYYDRTHLIDATLHTVTH